MPWWCLHHITLYKSKNLLSSDDVCWSRKLTSCLTYPSNIACSSHLQLEFSKDAPQQNLIVIGHTHGAWGSFIIDVGWSFTSFPFIGSLFKSKPKWIFLPPCQIYRLSHVVLCFNNFFSCQLHIYFNRQFLTSNIQTGYGTCQFVCCFFHSLFLMFIIYYGKIGTPMCK